MHSCSTIAEAEAAVSVNEKKWLVMHMHVQLKLDELRSPPNPWLTVTGRCLASCCPSAGLDVASKLHCNHRCWVMLAVPSAGLGWAGLLLSRMHSLCDGMYLAC
jgi:hypothetical protein